jgi:hypothetical protein
MQARFLLMLGSGVLLFGVGVAARTYMNIAIGKMRMSNGPYPRSTELKYKRLIKDHGAQTWPLALTAICMPLGVLITFAAIIFNNRSH